MNVYGAIKHKCPLCNKKLQFVLFLNFSQKPINRSINKNILNTRLLDFREALNPNIYGVLKNIQLLQFCKRKHAYEKLFYLDIDYNFASLISELELFPLSETASFTISNKRLITLTNDFDKEQSICQYPYFKKISLPFPYRFNQANSNIEKMLLLLG